MNTFIQKKFLLHSLSAIILIISSGAYALTAESQAIKARAAVGKMIIRCSPDGRNGTYTPETMITQLKDGATLVLMPGNYTRTIAIYKAKVIITSEIPEQCNVKINIYGRDCIVKNIYLDRLAIYRSIIITDSIINSITINSNSSTLKKGRLYFYAYNTAFKYIYSYSSAQSYTNFSHTVINGSVNWKSDQRALIEKSILYSKGKLFTIDDYIKRKTGRLGLKDCMLFADMYGILKTSTQGIKYGKTFKEFTRIWNVIPMGDTLLQKPVFMGKSPFLAKNSPGQGIGLIPEEHPFYEYFKKRATPDRSKNEPVQLSKKILPHRIHPKRTLPPRTPVHKNTEEENTPINGIPQPPEL